VLIAAVAVVIVPIVAGIWGLRKPQAKDDGYMKDLGGRIVIDIYSYDSDIREMRDLMGLHMSMYRNTGMIIGVGDDPPVYSSQCSAVADSAKELGMINRCAAEVKRMSPCEVCYFFVNIRQLNVRTSTGKEVYKCLSEGLAENHTMLLRLQKQ
jgi:hypothetical protein